MFIIIVPEPWGVFPFFVPYFLCLILLPQFSINSIMLVIKEKVKWSQWHSPKCSNVFMACPRSSMAYHLSA